MPFIAAVSQDNPSSVTMTISFCSPDMEVILSF
ncbi:hypothetical protein T4C_7951 [Trichinella pseudospiralis]|uniref:Uncharacterized protein n=1 Tax=Trichinella pseudospiralis TaxID=6337 RepID=A0A0V1H5Q5_TRIPS|nr:hypothetical protein T4C_7951 [Trichinella pseudospiralis]